MPTASRGVTIWPSVAVCILIHPGFGALALVELPYTFRGIPEGVTLILPNMVVGLFDLLRGHMHPIEFQGEPVELLRITQDGTIPASFHGLQNRR